MFSKQAWFSQCFFEDINILFAVDVLGIDADVWWQSQKQFDLKAWPTPLESFLNFHDLVSFLQESDAYVLPIWFLESSLNDPYWKIKWFWTIVT